MGRSQVRTPTVESTYTTPYPFSVQLSKLLILADYRVLAHVLLTFRGYAIHPSEAARVTAMRAVLAGATMLCAVFAGKVSGEPLSSVGGALTTAPGAMNNDPARRLEPQNDVRGPNAPTTSIIDRAATVTDVPSSSKTIELLLEMQGKNPGLEAGERPKGDLPEGQKQPRQAAAGAASQPFGSADPAHPFGGGELMSNKARPGADPQAVDWSEAPSSRFGGSAFGGSALGALGGGGSQTDSYRPPPAAGARSDEDDTLLRLPRAVVRFVRENRDMVIGSVLVLALLWIAAALVSGGRRK